MSQGVELKWFFPPTHGGQIDGFRDSAGEHFTGNYENYLAREVIQNSLDVHLDETAPVRVVFEYSDFPMTSLPGMVEYRDILQRVKDFTAKTIQEGAPEYFADAIEHLENDTLPILRISDFNTKGLDGGDEDYDGNWARLVFTEGVSASKGDGGGSFGIGKAAAFTASKLRAVYYSSKNGQNETVFMGKARIASWCDATGEVRRGIGQMGLPYSSGKDERVQSVRSRNNIPEIFLRTEQGTDINILGYYSTSENWKSSLIECVLVNFWASIYTEKLVVEFRDNNGTVKIERSNLKLLLEEYEAAKKDAMPYYIAMAEGECVSADLPHIGAVKLFYALAQGFPRKVIYMRKPKMTVNEWWVNKLHQDYAAVFLCDNDKGNAILRALEPAAHNEWNADRENGKYRASYKIVRGFITDTLSQLNINTEYKPEDVKDLGKWLPDKEERDDLIAVQAQKGTPADKESEEESPIEVGRSEPKQPLKVTLQKTQSLKVISGGPETREGQGEGPGDGEGSGNDTEKTVGNLTRIETSGLILRTKISKEAGRHIYTLILTPDNDARGAIRIMAGGDDADYPLTIAEAKDMNGNPLDVNGSFITNLDLKKDQPQQIAVQFTSNRRYALGVEAYER